MSTSSISWAERSVLYNALFSLGDVIPLQFEIDEKQCINELQEWESSWQKYNSRDMNNARFGLPYTSLNGEVIEPIGLDSLRQYNNEHGTIYSEDDFDKFTDVANSMESLKTIRDFFGTNLKRSHFLRLGSGGFFPPHRDSLNFKTFRIIIPLAMPGKFLLENTPVNFGNGSVYIVNTIKEHCLFSFRNYMLMLVMNISVNEHIIQECIKVTRSK